MKMLQLGETVGVLPSVVHLVVEVHLEEAS